MEHWMIVIIGYLIFTGGLMGICYCAEKEKRRKVFFICLIIVGFVFASVAFQTGAKVKIYKELAKEVDSKKVNAKGENISLAQIFISKKGNKIYIELIPGSTFTIASEAVKPREDSQIQKNKRTEL